eukprot:364159-Chlamydomonas_euryale.AAC.7
MAVGAGRQQRRAQTGAVFGLAVQLEQQESPRARDRHGSARAYRLIRQAEALMSLSGALQYACVVFADACAAAVVHGIASAASGARYITPTRCRTSFRTFGTRVRVCRRDGHESYPAASDARKARARGPRARACSRKFCNTSALRSRRA